MQQYNNANIQIYNTIPFNVISNAPVDTSDCDTDPISKMTAKHAMRLSSAFCKSVVSSPSVRKIWRRAIVD